MGIVESYQRVTMGNDAMTGNFELAKIYTAFMCSLFYTMFTLIYSFSRHKEEKNKDNRRLDMTGGVVMVPSLPVMRHGWNERALGVLSVASQTGQK
jgi:hypothetical protein